MNMRNAFNRLRSAIDLFGSAVRVAGALESRITPDPRDLRAMGIDPKAFSKLPRR